MDLGKELSHPPKIVVVDDDWLNRDLLSSYLTTAGCDVAAFPNGEQGWLAIQEILPDMALMDIRMPGPNGNEIAHRIRESDRLAQIPIILMTAFQLSEQQQEDFKTRDGVDRIIFKPLPDFDKFHDLIQDVISERKTKNTQGS